MCYSLIIARVTLLNNVEIKYIDGKSILEKFIILKELSKKSPDYFINKNSTAKYYNKMQGNVGNKIL